MKYRQNKIKREHHMIDGALSWLEDLSALPEVTDIIPGVIEVTNSRERGITYQYKTATGCKLMMKNSGTVQEVFVVTKNPQLINDWVKKLNEEYPSQEKPSAKQLAGRKNKEKNPEPEAGAPPSAPWRELGITENYRLVEINQGLRDSYVESLATMADQEKLPLEEGMGQEQRAALEYLKNILEKKS